MQNASKQRSSVRLLTALAAAASLGLVACGDDGPTQVELQVIEETDFAASLNIDLDQMTELASGVYIQDIVVGEGEPTDWDDFVRVQYQGFLSDGTAFDSGSFPFELGSTGSAILGFQEGVRGMRLGGQRKIIIPPELAYGEQSANAPLAPIPGGSILVFDLELTEVN